MIIRTGSLGDVEYEYADLSSYTLDQGGVEYAYSDLSSYGLPQQVYVTDTPVDVAYAYSDLSSYTLPGTGSQTAGGAWRTAGAQTGAGAQSPRTPQRQQSSGSMLLLVTVVGLGLFLGLS